MNRKLKTIIFIFTDIVCVSAAWTLSLMLTGSDFYDCLKNGWWYLIIGCFTACVFNFVNGLYKKIWRFADVIDAVKIAFSSFLEAVVFIIIAIISKEYHINWAIVCSVLYFIFSVGVRLVLKVWSYLEHSNKIQAERKGYKRVMIIGAGRGGNSLIREMRTSDKLPYHPVCVLDDDPKNIGQEILGVKVVGTTDDAVKFANQYNVEEIILAMPSIDKKSLSEIIKKCQPTKCKIMTIPGIYQLVNGSVAISDIKKVEISDLLGREQVKVNLDEIMGYIENKVVLVTGGGGSIGSELCRQIAAHNPKTLMIVDIYENNAYAIQQELVRKYPQLDLITLIASVRDSKRINNIFEKYKPDIVFHAAAHKHVPLMEDSPTEAVKNNISGTYKVADAAGRYGAQRFILISTDKAVNPTNIMGASKRVCEMIVQAMNKRYDTEYVAVRFGNVLGSNGSVIPLFQKQIEEGGPVTVTHKDIVRYFMTIPEAVSLVLQAGAYAKGGEIFVLDMGEPVRIYDMAINMIKLCGLEPFKDIDIKITGLRPGEKLYEERLMKEEGLKKTANELISIGKPLEFDEENLFKKIQELYVEARNETPMMKDLVHELVPTYKIDRSRDGI